MANWARSPLSSIWALCALWCFGLIANNECSAQSVGPISGFAGGPQGVAIRNDQVVFIACGGSSNSIYTLTGTSTVNIWASGGNLASPWGLAFGSDSPQTLYVAQGGGTVLSITSTQVQTVILTYTGASFRDLVSDGSQNLYVADAGKGQVLKFPIAAPSQYVVYASVSVACGLAYDGGLNRLWITSYSTGGIYYQDQTGSPVLVGNVPGSCGIALDSSHASPRMAYVISFDHSQVVTLKMDGTTATFASTGASPYHARVDAGGNLVVPCQATTTVDRITISGIAGCTISAPSHGNLGSCTSSYYTVEACTPGCSAGYSLQGQTTYCSAGTLVSTQTCQTFSTFSGMAGQIVTAAVASNGDLYAAGLTPPTIYLFPAGTKSSPTTWLSQPTLPTGTPFSIAFNASQAMFMAYAEGSIWTVSTSKVVTNIVPAGIVWVTGSPADYRGVTWDQNGNLLVADYGSGSIIRASLNSTGGYTMSVLTSNVPSIVGIVMDASTNTAYGVSYTAAGNLYAVNTITGAVTTVGYVPYGVGIAMDSSRTLLVGVYHQNSIWSFSLTTNALVDVIVPYIYEAYHIVIDSYNNALAAPTNQASTLLEYGLTSAACTIGTVPNGTLGSCTNTWNTPTPCFHQCNSGFTLVGATYCLSGTLIRGV